MVEPAKARHQPILNSAKCYRCVFAESHSVDTYQHDETGRNEEHRTAKYCRTISSLILRQEYVVPCVLLPVSVLVAAFFLGASPI